MWSKGPPIDVVAVAQTASAAVDDASFEKFVAVLTRRAEPPFLGPDSSSRVPRFGQPPQAVVVQRHPGSLVVRSLWGDANAANETLASFLDVVGAAAAAEVGFAFDVSPATVAVPVEVQARALDLPHAGVLRPRYRVYVPAEGAPKVSFDAWETPPERLPSMRGHELQFRVWDSPGEREANVIGAAIQNLRSASPGLLDTATEPVFQYYRDIVRRFSEEECEASGSRASRAPTTCGSTSGSAATQRFRRHSTTRPATCTRASLTSSSNADARGKSSMV